jgi:hypothetical protein
MRVRTEAHPYAPDRTCRHHSTEWDHSPVPGTFEPIGLISCGFSGDFRIQSRFSHIRTDTLRTYRTHLDRTALPGGGLVVPIRQPARRHGTRQAAAIASTGCDPKVQLRWPLNLLRLRRHVEDDGQYVPITVPKIRPHLDPGRAIRGPWFPSNGNGDALGEIAGWCACLDSHVASEDPVIRRHLETAVNPHISYCSYAGNPLC